MIDIEMAIRLRIMGVDNFWFSCAVPFLGTRLYDAYNKIKPEVDWNEKLTEFSSHEFIIDISDLSAFQINKLREKTMIPLNDKNYSTVGLSDIFKKI